MKKWGEGVMKWSGIDLLPRLKIVGILPDFL